MIHWLQLSLVMVVHLALFSTVQAGEDDLNVLPEEVDGLPPKELLEHYLRRETQTAFDRRRAEYESLKTPEQIAAYQKRHREFLWNRLGGMPKRTPLNPQIVGKIDGDGFRIEKLVFESRPRHYVTALLYLPISEAPFPGVIVPCGHTSNGKTGYQHICILLARNGIAALCYDPIGQGERYQLLDESGKPRFRSTDEHTLLGVGSMLVGRNTASYRVWDGIRALDYLASREDIDRERLGCTGNSGGGTLTEYLMALDDRIVCAAPSCCITTFERKLDTIGPGDAEQNIYGQIAFGLDHADYVIMRAPRPTLLLTATHDFVDIEGAWDIFRETKRLYTRMGFAERVDLIEVDGKHGFTQLKREAAVRWMRRWLLQQDDAIVEAPYTTLSHAELHCTPRGQAQLLENAVSVIDLNRRRAEELAAAQRAIWRSDRAEALARVRDLTGVRALADLPQRPVESNAKIQRDGYVIEKLTLHGDEGIVLPALLMRSTESNIEDASRKYILYLNDAGKHLAAAEEGRLIQSVLNGETVLAVDVRGVGETGSYPGGMWGGKWDDIFVSYLLGKSILGMRTNDALIAARYLQSRAGDAKSPRIEIIGVGALGPVALHAAALEPSMIAKVRLINATRSWEDVVQSSAPRGHLVNAIHGALEVYDLTDLAASLPKDRVEYVDTAE